MSLASIYALFDPRQPVELQFARYFGQTTYTLHERLISHLSAARNGDTRYVNNWIRSLWDDGVTPIISLVQIVEYVETDTTYDDLDNAEIFWIALGRQMGWRLTNHTDGGGGIRGYKHSTETRAKQSAIAKGRPKSPEHRANLSAALTGKPLTPAQIEGNTRRRGIPQSEETRKKHSETLKSSTKARAYWDTLIGRPMPEEQKLALSESHKANPKIKEAAELGGATFKQKFESDPEFAAAWKESQRIAMLTKRKNYQQCDECGMVTILSSMGRHQSISGHQGRTPVDPPE